MKCPNCSYAFNKGNVCPSCGIDVVLFNRTKGAAIRHYNKGLEKALKGDITGAIIDLNESIAFNKMNIESRNLLGLCYYEVGRIAQALKEWIISSSLKKDNNIAKIYIERLQKSGRELEKYNDAVIMYNQAVKYIKQKNDDLAIIQLKKAMDFNTYFVEGNNLLALCFIQRNDYRNALVCINRALKVDKKNPISLGYKRIIDETLTPRLSKSGRIVKKDDKLKQVRITEEPKKIIRRDNKKKNSIGRHEIIAFFIGAVATAIVAFTLIVPAWVEMKDKKITEQQMKIDQLEDENLNGTSKFSIEFKDMQTELERLRDENETLRTNAQLHSNLSNIQQVWSFVEENKFEEAAELLLLLDPESFDEETIDEYNDLKNIVFKEAAEIFYTKGKSDFLNNNYDAAKVHLEKSLSMVDTGIFIDDTLYYLGKIYESENDIDKAISYYERVINEFPDSNQFKNTKLSLESLQE